MRVEARSATWNNWSAGRRGAHADGTFDVEFDNSGIRAAVAGNQCRVLLKVVVNTASLDIKWRAVGGTRNEVAVVECGAGVAYSLKASRRGRRRLLRLAAPMCGWRG